MSFERAIVGIAALGLLLSSGCGSGGNPSGTYRGTCLNITCNLKADLVLSMVAEGNRISGNITITGDLVGSAPFSGVRDGSTISFTTQSQDGSIIAWIGTLKGNKIEGDYTVDVPTKIKIMSQGMIGDQKGVWSVTKL